MSEPTHAGADTRSILLVNTSAGQQWVARCCERATRAGVIPGVTLAHARALLPGQATLVLPFHPERDARALTALAEWATRFSPRVALDPPDGLFIDIAGCQRLFGGERRLMARLADAVAHLRLGARMAIAPTFGGAWAIARYSNTGFSIIDLPQLRATLQPLPVRALRIDSDIEAALREVGVETIGELLAIPRTQLAARFSSSVLLRLDQALGTAIEVIEPVQPSPPVAVEREFAGPTTQIEGIAIAVRELLLELTGELFRRGRGVLRLRVQLDRADLPPVRIDLVLSRPHRDANHLWRLLGPRMERVSMGFGVERIACTALRTGVIRHRQERAWEDSSSPEDTDHDRALGELVDQLVNRLGPDRVTRVEPIASYLPERAFVHRPWLSEEGSTVSAFSKTAAAESQSLADADHPSQLFVPPERVEVIALVPDGPIARLHWRGSDHGITQSHGPQRLALEWWQPDALPKSICRGRDYFKAQTQQGRWLWLYREVETGRWFIHGQWA